MTITERPEIWIVTYNFGSVKAGPVIRFMRYARLFEQQGYRVTFFTKRREGDREEMMNEKGIKSYHFECDSYVDLTQKTLYLATSGKNKPLALLFFSLGFQNYLDFYNARRRGVRLMYVCTMRLNLEKNGTNQRSWLRRQILSFVLKKLYSLMDAIISSTSELKKDFIGLSIPQSKLKVISNGVDTIKFSPATSSEKVQLRANFGLPQDKIIFLYVGLFVERKGVNDLIKTFKILREQRQDFMLLMVGHEMEIDENSEEFINSWPLLKEQAKENEWLLTHPFSNNIEKYYKAVNAFIFMSQLEGMPNVILESMACGLPVITTRFKGFSNDYGTEGEQYIVLTREHEVDANILTNIMDNPDLIAKLSFAARDKAVDDFSITSSINAYSKLFQSKG